MSTPFTALPLGVPIPGSPHSVSCSLPTLRDVVGYEEKDAAIVSRLATGYPRFVVHPFARELAAELSRRNGLSGRTLWLTSSESMARNLAAHVGADAGVFDDAGLHGVTHPVNAELFQRAKLYLQHLGGFVSSRQAEDALVAIGLRPAIAPEPIFAGDAEAEILRVLGRAFPGVPAENILLAPSGMNAFYGAFRAIAEEQASRGRTIWVQLGWLYLDTIAILKKFSSDPARDYRYLANVFDLAAIERLFADHGSRIAGIVTETPTNPLIQTADIPAIAAIAHRHGARVILDPTMASPFNIDVLPYADVVINSLTKFAAAEGDVIAGAAVVNPRAAGADALRAAIGRHLEPVYSRDLARLAFEIAGYESLVAELNRTTPTVAAFLESHPSVAAVYWARHPASAMAYARLARNADAVGAMISFSLKIPLARFYDRVRIPKGPSFGMRNSLLCPFMYLAHYDLVTTTTGRAELAASGLDPELIRLSIGIESADEIIAALAEALA